LRRAILTGSILFDHIEIEYDTLCETYLHRHLRSKRSGEGEAREFFALSAGEVRDALRDAREFLEEFARQMREAERLAKDTSDGVLLKPSEQDWEHYWRLLATREAEDGLRLDRALIENQLKLVIGKTDGLDRLATWKSHEVKKFDEAAFKDAEPKLFEAFMRTLVQRTFRIV
jgi:hypothetical protein